MRLDTPKTLGVYRLEGSSVTGFCLCEATLGNHLAAAFEGVDVPSSLDSLAELFNVGSTFFEPVQGVHLKLERVTGHENQREYHRQLIKLQDRCDLWIDVPGRGSGGLSLLLCGDSAAVELKKFA